MVHVGSCFRDAAGRAVSGGSAEDAWMRQAAHVVVGVAVFSSPLVWFIDPTARREPP